MKKLHLLIAAGVMALSLAGCGNGAEANSTTAADNVTEANNTTVVSTIADVENTIASESTEVEESTMTTETTESAEYAAITQTEEESSSEVADAETEPTEASEANALVVYFSATGNTKAVAETLAEMQGADLVEIVPEEPYTDADLDYNNASSRSTLEQNDADARPAISGTIDNMEDYEVVYVGYPIWWYDMPRIMYTFFDTYDFSGKTIVPFCTSGGSSLSGTPDTIAEFEPEATILDGIQIGSSAAHDAEGELSKWLAEIGLN